jgi:2'-hydroxyisoflavone reductase
MLTRRELLKLGVCTFAGTRFPAVLRAASPSKIILVLGGTDFLGPPVVERALERGHTFTLFNRGKTAPDQFPRVISLVPQN